MVWHTAVKRNRCARARTKKKTGFALMDKARMLACASAGGKKCHATGAGYKFTSEAAIEANAVKYARQHDAAAKKNNVPKLRLVRDV